jgi:hypothetical protein
MSKIGPREAQLRALKEARYEERQQRLRQITQPAEPVAPVTNVTNSVTNRPAAPSDKARVARLRAANPERYRTYMRDLMRKIRAETKEATA